jgi:hypothetical protein
MKISPILLWCFSPMLQPDTADKKMLPVLHSISIPTTVNIYASRRKAFLFSRKILTISNKSSSQEKLKYKCVEKLTEWKAPSRIHEQSTLVVSHHHLTAETPKPKFFRYAELLCIEQRPDFAQNKTLSYLQSTLSHNCVILIRKVHNCIMDRSTSSSIVDLYGKWTKENINFHNKTAITPLCIGRTPYLFITCW